MNKRRDLFKVADTQQGYFTSKQAEDCGISRSHFHRKLRSREWIKEMRGIYRLTQYPLTERPELVLWTLWSRDKKGHIQGVWSHETALDIHDLSDNMPSKMHMTVPHRFRKQIAIPKIIRLHFAILTKKDIETRHGYQVTTPLRTLLDIIAEGKLSSDLIAQAIREGLQKGILLLSDVNQTPQLMKYKHEYKI